MHTEANLEAGKESVPVEVQLFPVSLLIQKPPEAEVEYNMEGLLGWNFSWVLLPIPLI